MRRLLWLAPFALWACDDTKVTGDLVEIPEDDAAVVDMAVDAARDMAPVVDAAPPPPPILDAPEAKVYLNDPITDDGMLSQVVLHKSTDPGGRLTSEWVQVFNCLNEEGGLSADVDLGGLMINVSLCHEVQTVTPDADGHYLSVEPPEDGTDGNDQFAEVMMYHHVNRVHDYFKDTHGFSGLDFPLPAIVNLQIILDPPIPIPGFGRGADGWVQFPNAAFFPEESWDALAAQFGLPGRGSDAIIFGQAQHDFAYDARVIYHEYVHAVIGTGRLTTRAVVDEYGLDGSSFAMNEGLADYFAGTLAGDGKIGVWGIGQLSPTQVRDMSVPRRCPDNLLDEVHADGRIIGSTLWAVRDALGAEVTDRMVFKALEQFTVATTHQIAAELMLIEAADAGVEAEVRAIFEEFGLIDCVRSIEWKRWRATSLPHRVEGRQTVGVAGFGGGVPAYKQFHFEVPADALAVTLSWGMQAQPSIIGGGAGVEPLDLALRNDQHVEVVLDGQAEIVADQRYMPPLEEMSQTITLDRGCLTPGGTAHTLFVNTNLGAVNIVRLDIAVHTAIDEEPPNYQRCGELPPAPDMGVEPAPDAGMPMDAGAP